MYDWDNSTIRHNFAAQAFAVAAVGLTNLPRSEEQTDGADIFALHDSWQDKIVSWKFRVASGKQLYNLICVGNSHNISFVPFQC